jgi:hypothetical protein
MIAAASSLFVPFMAEAYGEPYYQPYYQPYYEGAYYSQPYYQPYYQGYYEGSYLINVTTNSIIGGSGNPRNLAVTGAVSAPSKSFLIDDPLDPINKLLYHSNVESPDEKNIYDGIVVLDEHGEAVVVLPAYFEALNKDFRYQVKPVSASMPNLYVKKEVTNNQFTIGGGVAGGKVSWQVTGNRHDAYAAANPPLYVVTKGPDAARNKGEFVFDGYASSTSSGSFFTSFASFFSSLWHAIF